MLAVSSAPIELFGVQLVGLNAENGRKLVLSLALVAAALVARKLLRGLLDALTRGQRLVRVRFWARQAVSLLAALVVVIGLISLWFDDPARLTTAIGLVTAGLAFALQKVITAIAGYFVIMRGKTFTIGDRIVMGGVRGDVIDLGFAQTTIMEMGQPPPVQKAEPAMWVQSRQYTGRLVTVSNARVFDEPIYNYTREFPFIWEELAIGISYRADRERAEALLLAVAERHTADIQRLGDEDRAELMRRHFMAEPDVRPRVYLRMTDNWLELAVRFLARQHGVRDLKDAMTRDLLRGLAEAGIEIASATYEIVAVPPLRVELPSPPVAGDRARGEPSGKAAH